MLVMVASAVISMLIGTKKQKINLQMNEKHAPIMRRGSYVNRLFMLPDYAKELRLTDISECIFRDYEKTISEHIGVTRRYKTKDALLGALSTLNSIGVYIAVVIMTLYKFAVLGTVSIGDFSRHSQRKYIGRQPSRLACGVVFKPARTERSDRPRSGVDGLQTVISRRYTACSASGVARTEKRFVLVFRGRRGAARRFSMKISRGEKIAVVGYNGAGKSTLIKLIMRLYDPKSGCILLNGVDAREYRDRGEAVAGASGAVLQGYRVSAATVAENVLGDRYDDSKEGTVLEALHRATFDDKLAELEGGIKILC